VPPELATVILDMAEFWIGQAWRKNEEVAATADYTCGNSASMYYLVTDPIGSIPLDSDEQSGPVTKVKRVRFTLLSHDQGWGGDYDCRGTYKNCWSWFEAAIIKEDASDIPSQVKFARDFDAEAFKPDGHEVKNSLEKSKRWFLQSNVHVSRAKNQHVIEWNRDEDDYLEEASEVEGTGRGKGFVSTLQGGQRIAVVVRAQYPGWANHVYDVNVEVFSSII